MKNSTDVPHTLTKIIVLMLALGMPEKRCGVHTRIRLTLHLKMKTEAQT
jgi:hypothetical protein